MKTALIGGTFNPVHIGHLYLAEEVRKQLGYERIVFVPSHIPAHKKADTRTKPQERLEMLKLSTTDTDIVVEDLEIRRGGVSYTIETIRELEEAYRIDGKIGLVIGDDLLEGLPAWKSWPALREKVDLIIAHRSVDRKLDCPYAHTYLNNLTLPISSSDIRQRVETGQAFRFLVPDSVFFYIREKGLYGAG